MSITELRKVSRHELNGLNLILKDRLPKTAMLSNVLHCLRNEKFSSKVQTEFYTHGWNPSSDNRTSSANVVILAIQTYCCLPERLVIFSTPEDVDPDFLVQLEGLLDWTQSYIFAEVDQIHAPFLGQLIRKNMKGEGPLPVVWYNCLCLDGNLPNLDSDFDALCIAENNVEDICVKRLRAEDARKIVESWQNRSEGAHELIQDAIESLPSAGIFINDELISWGLVTHGGSFNALHTVESYRRHGFSVHTMKALVQGNLKNGLIPIVHLPANCLIPALQNLMGKANLVYSHDVYWMQFIAGSNIH